MVGKEKIQVVLEERDHPEWVGTGECDPAYRWELIGRQEEDLGSPETR